MTTTLPTKTRRNNLITLVLLILFAIGLCALVLISMRVHARRVGNGAYPDQPSTFAPPSSLNFAA